MLRSGLHRQPLRRLPVLQLSSSAAALAAHTRPYGSWARPQLDIHGMRCGMRGISTCTEQCLICVLCTHLACERTPEVSVRTLMILYERAVARGLTTTVLCHIGLLSWNESACSPGCCSDHGFLATCTFRHRLLVAARLRTTWAWLLVLVTVPRTLPLPEQTQFSLQIRVRRI